MQKILLDTDIGGDIDDAICLAYLLKEPQCDLLGITTVCGEPEKRAAVADAICRAAGRQVPIVAGLDTTLQPVPLYPTPEGAGALEQWPHSTYEKGDAPEFLYEKIRENPHQVVLIAIGNLTNVATLFTAHPDAVGLLKGLSVMNGYFGQERLPEPLYNWNSWADPMASKIVFASAPAFHRAVPLEVTDTLTIEAGQAEVLFPADSPLLQAVYAFGNAWLESSSKLTLHDPLAAVSVFHPDICQFERGFVQVETERESDMGGTAFTPSPQGTVEIARSVDRERFYRIVSAALRGEGSGESRRSLPEAVLRRAQSLGAVGEAWLANLESTIAALEGQWNVTVGQALSGGTHGFVAPADGKNGEAYVVKIELPDSLGGDFTRGVTALEKAGGQGYAKLYAYDAKRKACLLERLGMPIDQLGLSVKGQLEILCAALEKTWALPTGGAGLLPGEESIAWFREYLAERWESLGHPCPREVLERAFGYLRSREAALDPGSFVLVHGDPHGGNALRTLEGDGYKLIDPDGLWYEKAYDLGVLLREWREDYAPDPVQKGKERCAYLHQLTGVDKEAIFQWGFLQCVSTGLLYWDIHRETGQELLGIAQAWLELEGNL